MTDTPSYIDYDVFLSPEFSPVEFANSLVLSTNNATDTPLDLATPLSKVLFDIQEIDTHIHDAASKAAVPLLSYTHAQSTAGTRIADEVQAQVKALTDDYARLERDVVARWQEADDVRRVVERLWETVRLGRVVARCLALGRQLEVQMAELLGSGSSAGAAAPAGTTQGKKKRDDHRALVRIAHTLLSLRQIFLSTKTESAGGYGDVREEARLGNELAQVRVIKTLQDDLIVPAQKHVIARAAQIVREFSMTSAVASSGAGARDTSHPASGSTMSTSSTASAMTTTYIQTEETKSRTTSALLTLYLLSPVPQPSSSSSAFPSRNNTEIASFQPDLLISALQSYLQTALTSSLASLVRALGSLSTLDRTLAEISARCQNIVALEALLRGVKRPVHPLLPQSPRGGAVASELLLLSGAVADGGVTDPLNGAMRDMNLNNPPDDHGQDDEDINEEQDANLLTLLLNSLDASSLPSHFWRSLASAVGSRLEDLTSSTSNPTNSSSGMANNPAGNISIRNLRANQQRIREAIRQCVLRGFQNPINDTGSGGRTIMGNTGGSTGGGAAAGREREVAVMVGAVLGVLSR